MFSYAHTSSVLDLVKNINNKTFNLDYYFWSTSNNDVFLMKRKKPHNSLWAYTQEKKWRPLHNTGAFDGYEKEGIHFESIKYDNGNVQISRLLNEDMSPEVLKINKIAENRNYKVGYYFWKANNDTFYLMRENKINDYSIWNYTLERKWRPIHNADAFDGFDKVGKTIQHISFDKKEPRLTLGKKDDDIKYTINLNSSDLDNSKHFNSEFFKLSPRLSWSISDNLKSVVKNFVIIMRNTKTNELIWSKVATSHEYNLSKGLKDTSSGDFCSKSYEHKSTKEKILNVSIAIYAINTKCSTKVESENITSNKINATLDVSILTNVVDKFYENYNNDGSIKDKLVLEFKNNKFSGKTDISLLKISNLPTGLTPSYTIENNELYITLNGKANNNEGIKNITITLDSKIWSDDVSNQTISTSISFLQNSRDISDIQQEQYYKYSWHQKPSSFLGSIPISPTSHSHIEEAWKITRGKGVIVAVIDTDFDLYHKDLRANFISSYNGKTGGSNVSPTHSGLSHGTLVAGAVAAPVNGIGVVGAAPEAKMLFINFPFTRGLTSDLIRAFEYAKANGAKIINCSWGSPFVPPSLKAKIKELYDEGIIVLFATGNDNANLDHVNVAAHSKLPTVLAVGASSEINTKASYSNYGSQLDFLAPAGKYGIPTTDVTGSAGGNTGMRLLNNDYGFSAGTSLATPSASGIVALMVSVNPDIKPEEVRTIIRETADKIVGGYDSSGFNIQLGYGRINAFKAVSRARAIRK